MKDFKFTITSILTSIVANLITPFIQSLLSNQSFNLLDYWYLFLIVILFFFLIELVKLVFDKDKCDLWRSRLYDIFSKIVSSQLNEKKYILNDLNARINLARRELDYTNSILPKLVNIEWVEDAFSNSETYDLKEGQFIVKVFKKDSQIKNIITIASAVTKRTSLIGIRYIVENNKDLEYSIDEIITENILKKVNNKHVLDYYYRDYLQPCLNNNVSIKSYFEHLKSIDNLGMFFRIFLVELEFFSNRIVGQQFKPFLLGEIEHFLNYLKEISPDKTPDKVELSYEKAFLKLGILLIRSDKMLQVGTANYLKMVDHYLNSSYNSFYVVYFEKQSHDKRWYRFNNLIDDLIKDIRNRITVEQIYDEHYQVYTDKYSPKIGRCIRFINTDRI